MRCVPAAAAVLLLAACATSEGAGGPTTMTSGTHLSPGNQAALAELASVQPAALDAAHLEHDVAGHDVWGPVAEPVLDAATAADLERQWAAAVEAATSLATPEDAEAAGYQRSALDLPGVGAHYVRWDLVDRPFDPARPSMLLYDESPDRAAHLAGFSYWLRSPGAAPDGFAGGADHWHMHHGLCFVDGMLRAEGVADPADCAGTWLAGTDLWMAHAWVSPAAPNPWGRFAPRNPSVCPPDSEQMADYNRCPNPLPVDDHPTELLEANELVCTIPTSTGSQDGTGS